MKTNRSRFAPAVIGAAIAALFPSMQPSASAPGAAISGPDLRASQGSPSAKAASQAQPGGSGYALAQLLGASGGSGFHRGGGNPPKVWGMSAACARMVRHNKLRRIGLGGQKI